MERVDFICCSIQYTLSRWLCNADHGTQASTEVLLLGWLTDRGISVLAPLVHVVPSSLNLKFWDQRSPYDILPDTLSYQIFLHLARLSFTANRGKWSQGRRDLDVYLIKGRSLATSRRRCCRILGNMVV